MSARIRSLPRLLLGFALAPIVATFVIPVGNCFLALVGDGANCPAGLTGFAWYGLLPAIVSTILPGAPLLFLALRLGWVRAWQFALCGTGVGGLAAALISFADRHIDTLGMFTISIPIGVIAGGVVWVVGVRGNLSADATTTK
jgi:ABC-type Fe3+ transport system permease subunit